MTDDELKNNPQDELDTSSFSDGNEKDENGRKQNADDVTKEPVLTQGEQNDLQPEADAAAEADPFTELRRNLKEDAAVEKEKKQKSIVGRITSKLKRNKKAAIETHADEEKHVDEEAAELNEDVANSPSDEQIASLMEPAEESGLEPSEEETTTLSPEQDVEDFILSLEPSESAPIIIAQREIPVELVQDEDVEEPSKETDALQPNPEHDLEGDERYETMREVALEDYGKEPETEDIQTHTLVQRLKVIRKGLKPIERVLLVGVAGFFIIACMVVVGTLIFPRSSMDGQATPAPTQDLPFPVRLKLAGSGYFDLHRGKVENGKWNLKSKNEGVGEWLDGTEVCKWVALSWNVQLEAVVRSLTPKDEIEITMSNTDILTYKVYSIRSVPVDQIETLERSGACLLVILANEDADTRWVVTALP